MLLQAYKYYLLEESLLILQSSYVRMLNFLPEIHMNEKRPEWLS